MASDEDTGRAGIRVRHYGDVLLRSQLLKESYVEVGRYKIEGYSASKEPVEGLPRPTSASQRPSTLIVQLSQSCNQIENQSQIT